MPSVATESVDLIVHARWVLGPDDSHPLLDEHCVVIRDGIIIQVMASEDAHLQFHAHEQISLTDHVLMPGMVNAHGHAAMSLLRGAADDLALHTWLEDYIWPLEGRWVAEEFVYHGTQLAIAEMLLSGTTCFADMYFFPNESARAASEIGIRAQMACPVIDFPTAWAENSEEYISKATALNDQYRHHPLISVAFGPHAPYTVSDAPLVKIATFAEELDIPIHMHVHETTQEVSDALSASGKRPMQRLAELGLISPRLLCVHATTLDDADITLLQQGGASVVHCPESNMKLASGFCPVSKLQNSGINVALGTDGAASNNDLDMFGEMRTAALLAKAVAGDAQALPALQALRMATINGAKALGLESQIGSLEAGKCADMIAVNLNALNAIPTYHPLSQLVYSTHSNQVSHVWVAGKLLVDAGELCTIDVDTLRRNIQTWQQRIVSDTQY